MNGDLRTIFQLRNIQHIVYVDDDFYGYDAYKDNCYARCHYLLETKGELPFECDSSTIDENFEAWWSTSRRIEDFIAVQNIQRNTTRIEQNISELCADEVDSKSFSPKQFIEHIQDIKAFPEEENILFLIDKELEGTINSDRIIELLNDVPNKYIALFSGKFSPEDEITEWREKDAPKEVYPLAKVRLENDTFVEGVRNVVWLQSVSSLKVHSFDLLSSAFDSVRDSLRRIDPSTFEKLVVDVSSKEGCWEFDTLYRLILLLLTQTVQNNITSEANYVNFQKLSHDVRDVKQALPHMCSAYKNEELVRVIQEHEWYDDGAYLNSVYAQIGNGDIFKIGDGERKYMLLCQPCSIAIRENGKRSYDLDYTYLVPIINSSEKPYSTRIQCLDGDAYVDFAACKRISLDILDLVSYNSEGKAMIDLRNQTLQQADSTILQKNMLDRYEKIWEKIHLYYQMYQAVDSSEIPAFEKGKLLTHLKRPYEMGDPSLVKVPIHPQHPQVLQFRIQRVKRYKDPYVQDLLQKFMRYLSRPGFAPNLMD